MASVRNIVIASAIAALARVGCGYFSAEIVGATGFSRREFEIIPIAVFVLALWNLGKKDTGDNVQEVREPSETLHQREASINSPEIAQRPDFVSYHVCVQCGGDDLAYNKLWGEYECKKCGLVFSEHK
jgi:transcription initiation factor TFIIIB Brf1 subunit/transcription initiation factor TFIIB